jgi:glycerol-3-phosphate dehydrogenase (NAD(P)+)
MGKRNILIIGHGEMGQAFEFLLAREDVHVWERRAQLDLGQLAAHCRFVFFCVPANPVFELASSIAPHLANDTICLSIAKGLDDAGRPAALALKAALGTRARQGVIYGPMISEELRAGRVGFGELGVRDKSTCDNVRGLFEHSGLKLYCHNDIDGLTWCAVLKNVYAMAFGMADELRLGANVRGFLTATAMSELSKITSLLGGDRQTPYGLAGLGDLITTATSEDSHHHSLGRQLARGDRSQLQGEGVHTLQLIKRNNTFKYSQFPLFLAIENIVDGSITAEQGLSRLWQV